jgi:hypothetical protein
MELACNGKTVGQLLFLCIEVSNNNLNEVKNKIT